MTASTCSSSSPAGPESAREPLARVPCVHANRRCRGRSPVRRRLGVTASPRSRGKRERIRGFKPTIAVSRLLSRGLPPRARPARQGSGSSESQRHHHRRRHGRSFTGTGTTGVLRSDYGYVDTSEDVFAFGLDHRIRNVPVLEKALARFWRPARWTIAFTPHLGADEARGSSRTCQPAPRARPPSRRPLRGACEREYRVCSPSCASAPRNRGAVPTRRWATGSNLAFIAYAFNARHRHVIADLGARSTKPRLRARPRKRYNKKYANLITGQPGDRRSRRIGRLPA
jgi:hypothetical protein